MKLYKEEFEELCRIYLYKVVVLSNNLSSTLDSAKSAGHRRHFRYLSFKLLLGERRVCVIIKDDSLTLT